MTTLDFSGGDGSPVTVAFGVGEVAVEDGDLVESAFESADGLGGEADFGDEDDGLAASGDDVFDGGEVDLGLAAAGDSVEEEGGEGVGFEGGAELGEDGGLFLAEFDWSSGGLDGEGPGFLDGGLAHAALDGEDEAGFAERGDGAGAAVGESADVVEAQGGGGSAEEGEDFGLFGGEFEGIGAELHVVGDDEVGFEGGAGTFLDPGGDDGVEGLAPGAGVVGGDPPGEVEHGGVDEGGSSRTSRISLTREGGTPSARDSSIPTQWPTEGVFPRPSGTRTRWPGLRIPWKRAGMR